LARTETLALVGSESLMGREIRDLLSSNSLGQDLKLIAAAGEEAGKLTDQGGEPAFLVALEKENLESAGVVFLAGPPDVNQKARDLVADASLIDLTQALEDEPQARLRAPMVEPPGYEVPDDSIHIIANSAAIAITLVLNRLHREHKIARAVAHVFEPASEKGSSGVQELQQQTVGLLSFKGQPKEVYDAQLAFNLLARFGEDAPMALEETELRIERHLATLLSHSGHGPIPSLRLIQAPVFHGYSISLWIEFESNPGVTIIEHALAGVDVDVRAGDTEPPDAVGMAGERGLAVGGIALDRNNPKAAWLWVVTDNLRLQAENAISVAQQLL
jgi:aspartate-semialdehyde dehydrogenase